MVTQKIVQDTNSYVNNETCKKFHPEVDKNGYDSLHLSIIIFIIFMWTMDCYYHAISKDPRSKPKLQRVSFSEERKEETQQEQGELQKEIDKRRALFRNDWQNTSLYPDWRKEFFQAANVILDPATAHPALILSEENRCVTCGEKSQDLPKDPQRFNSLPCVLGHPVVTSGRFYWEVDIRDSGAWDLGICRHNVMRQGRICVKPEDGFWAIRFYKDEYWALTSPEMQLTLKEHPTRVCIFLEYENGRISFYNMTDESHMHTFSQGSFNGSVRPFFRLWLNDSKHLTICPAPKA